MENTVVLEQKHIPVMPKDGRTSYCPMCTTRQYVTDALAHRLKPAGVVNAHTRPSVCVVSPGKRKHKGVGRVKSYKSCIMTALTQPVRCILPTSAGLLHPFSDYKTAP